MIVDDDCLDLHISKGSIRVGSLHIRALGLGVAEESRHGSLRLIRILCETS